MGELRSYNPTARDKIAQLLMGNERTGTARSNLVQGIMGSRGLGSSGMGLVDLTPAGIPLGAQEGYNQDGALGAAAAMIPGYNTEGKLIKSGTESVAKALAGEVRQGIKAYHGSPHDFNKFDLDKMGSGEGYQIHAPGMYFAEHEPTAAGYAARLSKINPLSPEVKTSLKELDYLGHDEPWSALRDIRQSGLPDDDFINSMPDQVGTVKKWMDENPIGKIYETNISAEPHEFIQSELPINQQSEFVQEKLKSLGYPIDEKSVRGKISNDSRLPESGIKGIRYLDEQANNGSNNYVVFNPSIVDILKKYGVAGSVPASGLLGLGEDK